MGVLETELGSFLVVLGGDADGQNGDIQGLIPRCNLAAERDVVTDVENMWCRGRTWKDRELTRHRRGARSDNEMSTYRVGHVYLRPVLGTHSEDVVNQPQSVAQRDVPSKLILVLDLLSFLAAHGDERR